MPGGCSGSAGSSISGIGSPGAGGSAGGSCRGGMGDGGSSSAAACAAARRPAADLRWAAMWGAPCSGRAVRSTWRATMQTRGRGAPHKTCARERTVVLIAEAASREIEHFAWHARCSSSEHHGHSHLAHRRSRFWCPRVARRGRYGVRHPR